MSLEINLSPLNQIREIAQQYGMRGAIEGEAATLINYADLITKILRQLGELGTRQFYLKADQSGWRLSFPLPQGYAGTILYIPQEGTRELMIMPATKEEAIRAAFIPYLIGLVKYGSSSGIAFPKEKPFYTGMGVEMLSPEEYSKLWLGLLQQGIVPRPVYEIAAELARRFNLPKIYPYGFFSPSSWRGEPFADVGFNAPEMPEFLWFREIPVATVIFPPRPSEISGNIYGQIEVGVGIPEVGVWKELYSFKTFKPESIEQIPEAIAEFELKKIAEKKYKT